MLNNTGFNLWANSYDQTVEVSEESNLYPFAGYKEILNQIFNLVMQKKNAEVLDIGFGTAVLTTKLYENGHRIDGLDFSSEMISIAQEKMPAANLLEWDISNGLPAALEEKKYDFIVSTYTLHHLNDDEKVTFIRELLSHLKAGGQLLVGDIAFGTREQLDACRADHLEHWDEDEFYFVADELKDALQEICEYEFHKVSHCGGVMTLSHK
ncbi:class I SAM-dependent methyltransferase [Jeotgalibacillus haloalkalitolerans]|uniref:Class I SAM-dependent methyltransferase n=1 Tax=Jeotgalibacillus haloalkalitolerans TaxID=3104292 RepID=A0ABU5KHH4_9BACL|nr:class I SAM-dependent methyltransferase [Jeotgalibacillus sp. HH7-29]MDZ5710694.1 class I SAM-dependent methyltransferase [Jeotgalibacillus sp. HH7-29]